ncbi:hypothetical protein MMC21_001587 [Puttea exsequens]|nr:hypothetical protein [Puttea exsequens]
MPSLEEDIEAYYQTRKPYTEILKETLRNQAEKPQPEEARPSHETWKIAPAAADKARKVEMPDAEMKVLIEELKATSIESKTAGKQKAKR